MTEKIHESIGWHLFALLMFLFLTITLISGLFVSIKVINDAHQKELKPLKMALTYARKDARILRNTIVRCFNGDTLLLKDGNLYHYAECGNYTVKTLYFSERP